MMRHHPKRRTRQFGICRMKERRHVGLLQRAVFHLIQRNQRGALHAGIFGRQLLL